VHGGSGCIIDPYNQALSRLVVDVTFHSAPRTFWPLPVGSTSAAWDSYSNHRIVKRVVFEIGEWNRQTDGQQLRLSIPALW